MAFFLTVLCVHSTNSAFFGSVIDLFFSSLRVTFLAFSNICLDADFLMY